MGQILAQGWQRGESGRIAYTLEPLPDCPNRWRFTIAKRGRDDWGRVSIAVSYNQLTLPTTRIVLSSVDTLASKTKHYETKTHTTYYNQTIHRTQHAEKF